MQRGAGTFWDKSSEAGAPSALPSPWETSAEAAQLMREMETKCSSHLYHSMIIEALLPKK